MSRHCLGFEVWSLSGAWSLEFGAFYLPSVAELGKPFSQLFGVFQGRSETFSDSVVAQPDRPTTARKRANSSKHTTARPLTSDLWSLVSIFMLPSPCPGSLRPPGFSIQLSALCDCYDAGCAGMT